MRITTTLEVLKRAAAGDQPADIATGMHLRETVVRQILASAGWPDLDAMRDWRAGYLAEEHRDVWAIADTAEGLAQSIRVREAWVHAYTAELSHQDLRALVAVMAAMLPKGVDPTEALAWTGAKRPVADETPKRHRNPRPVTSSVPKILELWAAGKTIPEIAKKTRLLEDTIARVIGDAAREAAA